MVWKPALVIFDCDGVLVDSEPIATRIIAAALTKAGLEMSGEAALHQYLGGKLTRIKIRVEEDFGIPLGDGWVEGIYEQQFAAFRAELKAIPGIVEALDALDLAGIQYCVGSNGPLYKMDVSLGVTGLHERLEHRIFSADMVPEPKPAPDLFLHAAASFDVPPGDVAVVEDSPPGVRAGVAAGMRVFGYGRDSGVDRLKEAGAQVTFENMADLPKLLGVGA
ncbi:HAD family hydrolase [Thalassobaculum sp. OXR-137]|uniref:HAD family hydrolase n=1 Tax=Thalassobaculum sp. OXR-137 TaxID=3100173 RepID=UPI002AC9298F|nr:HAD family hydrolase [Thalassobaculum sp. OXR-137]WPZ33358.1 HAD family hydrolase [Thalassobaculum sp. OXR-137]